MRSYWIRAGPYKKRENWADTQREDSHVEKEAETAMVSGQAKDTKD